MRWHKLGNVYKPSGDLPWARTHSIAPTPWLMSAEVLRIFAGFCDEATISRVGFVDVSAHDPTRVLGFSGTPALDIGEPGAFDDNGVVPLSIVDLGSELRLFYVGFRKEAHVPYTIFTGLAVSTDRGCSFRRLRRTPILDRRENETTWRTAPCVRRIGSSFRMWYCGGSEWEDVEGKLYPRLEIRCLDSADGIDWRGEPRLCLSPDESRAEFALARPWLIGSSGLAMIFAIRSRLRPYRFGLATSTDGLSWRRRDEEVGINVSADGWDSEMLYAPATVTLHDRTLLFYNGNVAGKSGFGAAETILEAGQ